MVEPGERQQARVRETRGGRGTHEVVHGIDLDVARGRVVALVGESGSGKTVTAMSVLRLHGPEVRVGGEVLLDGSDVLGLDPGRLPRGPRRAGWAWCSRSRWRPGTRSTRSAGRSPRPPRRTAVRSTRVEDLLASVGLERPGADRRGVPHQLSGGQLQRAMIAMATSGDPEVLIADEPTTALDVTVQAGILDLLRGWRTERDSRSC